MADPAAPRTVFVKVGGAWSQVDGIDSGASQVKIAGTWRNLTEMYVKVGGVWSQVFKNTNPGATTLASRAFTTTSFTASWTNPSGVWTQEIKRRLQSATDTEANYTTVFAQSTTVRTSFTQAVTTGTVGSTMANPVIGSTTNVQGPRYVYRIRNWDDYGHISELQIDTLRGRVVSPLYVRATNSATWRGTAFRTDTTVQAVDAAFTRAYQGYTTTGMNYGHYWFGGTGNGIVNNCFGNVLLPTSSAADWMGCRDSGGIGDGAGGAKPTAWMHGQLTRGTTNAWSNNGTSSAGNSQLRETQAWNSLGTTNGDYLIAGTYKGIVLYDSDTTVQSYGTSTNYYSGYAYNEPQSTNYPGTLRITHSG